MRAGHVATGRHAPAFGRPAAVIVRHETDRLNGMLILDHEAVRVPPEVKG